MWLLIVSFLCCFSGGAQADYWQDPPFDQTQDAKDHNVTWLAGPGKLFIPENLPLNSSVFNLYYNDSYGLSISMDCSWMEFAEYDASKILCYTKQYDFEEVKQSLFINFLIL